MLHPKSVVIGWRSTSGDVLCLWDSGDVTVYAGDPRALAHET